MTDIWALRSKWQKEIDEFIGWMRENPSTFSEKDIVMEQHELEEAIKHRIYLIQANMA